VVVVGAAATLLMSYYYNTEENDENDSAVEDQTTPMVAMSERAPMATISEESPSLSKRQQREQQQQQQHAIAQYVVELKESIQHAARKDPLCTRELHKPVKQKQRELRVEDGNDEEAEVFKEWREVPSKDQGGNRQVVVGSPNSTDSSRCTNVTTALSTSTEGDHDHDIEVDYFESQTLQRSTVSSLNKLNQEYRPFQPIEDADNEESSSASSSEHTTSSTISSMSMERVAMSQHQRENIVARRRVFAARVANTYLD
jgi:hypothetical protein